MQARKVYLIAYSYIIMFLFISPSAIAASYYVDATNGNDRNDGLSPARAWKTIGRVNRETFNPGDEIKFKRGEVFDDYFLYLKIPYSGNKGNPITFKDYGKPHDPLPILTYSSNTTIWMIDKVFVSFNNLELVGGKNQVIEIKQSAKGETHHLVFKNCLIRDSHTGIWVDTATGGLVEGCEIYHCGVGLSLNDPAFTVRNCKIHDNNCGIEMGAYDIVIERNEIYNNRVGIRYNPGRSEYEVIFRYNVIRNNTSHGFETIFGYGRGNIYYNIFSNNGGDGLFLKGKVSGNIYNNLIYSNGLNGIHLAKERGQAPSTIVLKNNIIMDSKGFEMNVVKGVGNFTSDYNCIYHSAGGTFMHWSGMDYNWKDWENYSSQDAHSINKPPLLIDETKNNFRLKAGSPCINAGINVGLKGVDYYGNPIPCGNFDMGVHEVHLGKDALSPLKE